MQCSRAGHNLAARYAEQGPAAIFSLCTLLQQHVRQATGHASNGHHCWQGEHNVCSIAEHVQAVGHVGIPPSSAALMSFTTWSRSVRAVRKPSTRCNRFSALPRLKRARLSTTSHLHHPNTVILQARKQHLLMQTVIGEMHHGFADTDDQVLPCNYI